MGMTVWVNYLKEGHVSSDESDKSAMYRHVDKLDKLCVKLGVPTLSGFLDTTDLEVSMSDEPVDTGNTWELMARKGKWFHPDEGVKVLSALIEQLQKQPIRFGLLSDGYPQVMQDLSDCRDSIIKARQDGAQFHLCVVA